VRRPAQSLLIILIGGTVLWITLVTRTYLNYVKPYFHPALIATGIILVLLGATALTRYARAAAGHDHAGHEQAGHEHGEQGPRVAWLLALPVLAIFLLAPPALGSYTAERDTAPTTPPPGGRYDPLPVLGEPNDIYIGEFIGRSYMNDGGGLSGREVRLLGFVAPGKAGGWYLSRIQISCCAADARVWKIRIEGAAAPPTDSWVQVTGVWSPREPGEDPTAPPTLTAQTVRKTDAPANPYEEFN
jgi:uncharacterized repeat protein (TIGR03943 family)